MSQFHWPSRCYHLNLKQIQGFLFRHKSPPWYSCSIVLYTLQIFVVPSIRMMRANCVEQWITSHSVEGRFDLIWFDSVATAKCSEPPCHGEDRPLPADYSLQSITTSLSSEGFHWIRLDRQGLAHFVFGSGKSIVCSGIQFVRPILSFHIDIIYWTTLLVTVTTMLLWCTYWFRQEGMIRRRVCRHKQIRRDRSRKSHIHCHGCRNRHLVVDLGMFRWRNTTGERIHNPHRRNSFPRTDLCICHRHMWSRDRCCRVDRRRKKHLSLQMPCTHCWCHRNTNHFIVHYRCTPQRCRSWTYTIRHRRCHSMWRNRIQTFLFYITYSPWSKTEGELDKLLNK